MTTTTTTTAAMLTKTTQVYAYHGLPLEDDIYTDSSSSSSRSDAPVFLYFHPGGLVNWGRDCIPPWLVQVSERPFIAFILPALR